eukprot:778713-Pelagomonas_calceolata.AAC.2
MGWFGRPRERGRPGQRQERGGIDGEGGQSTLGTHVISDDKRRMSSSTYAFARDAHQALEGPLMMKAGKLTVCVLQFGNVCACALVPIFL